MHYLYYTISISQSIITLIIFIRYVRDLRLIEQKFIQPIKEEEQTYKNKQLPENLNKIFNSISYFLFIHEVISTVSTSRRRKVIH